MTNVVKWTATGKSRSVYPVFVEPPQLRVR